MYLAALVLVGLAPSVALLGVAFLFFGATHGVMNDWAAEV